MYTYSRDDSCWEKQRLAKRPIGFARGIPQRWYSTATGLQHFTNEFFQLIICK